jgi:hypothetical protein
MSLHFQQPHTGSLHERGGYMSAKTFEPPPSNCPAVPNSAREITVLGFDSRRLGPSSGNNAKLPS